MIVGFFLVLLCGSAATGQHQSTQVYRGRMECMWTVSKALRRFDGRDRVYPEDFRVGRIGSFDMVPAWADTAFLACYFAAGILLRWQRLVSGSSLDVAGDTVSTEDFFARPTSLPAKGASARLESSTLRYQLADSLSFRSRTIRTISWVFMS